MEYVIDNIAISHNIMDILQRIKEENTCNKLQYFEVSGTGIKVQCPFHAEGHEHHPSAYINLSSTNAPYLWFHCFTCSTSYPFETFVAACFNKSVDWAKKWLINNFSIGVIKSSELDIINLKPIELNKTINITKKYFPESYLDSFIDWHPYMAQRKLTPEIVKRFQIKYDPITRSIIFPTRDINGKLTGITRRTIDTKSFNLGVNMSKDDIFLLYEAKKYSYCIIVESQINALTSWEYGMPAVALYGAGTTMSQVDILSKSPITTFILFYDNDIAGRKGAEKFKKLISKNKFVVDIIPPLGKDLNDLTKDEFIDLLNKYHVNYIEEA